MDELSDWGSYTVLLIAGFLALLPPLLSLIINQFFQHAPLPPSSRAQATIFKSSGSELRLRKLNTRYFSGIALTLLLISMALLLLPLSGTLGDATVEFQSGYSNLFSFILIVIFIILGILYANNKGDLTWLKSFKEGKNDKTE